MLLNWIWLKPLWGLLCSIKSLNLTIFLLYDRNTVTWIKCFFLWLGLLIFEGSPVFNFMLIIKECSQHSFLVLISESFCPKSMQIEWNFNTSNTNHGNMFSIFHVCSAGIKYENMCLHSCHSLIHKRLYYLIKKVAWISLFSVIGHTVQFLICWPTFSSWGNKNVTFVVTIQLLNKLTLKWNLVFMPNIMQYMQFY